MKFELQYSALIFLVLFFAATVVSEGDGKDVGRMYRDDDVLGGQGAELVEEREMKMSKKSGKKKKKQKGHKEDCVVSDVLRSMSEYIKELSLEIQGLKVAVSEQCPNILDDFAGNETMQESSAEKIDNSLQVLNETYNEMEGENMDEGDELLPPIPTECPDPFQPVGSGCYYFLYYPKDWKSWGESNRVCQGLDGRLATPRRPQALRVYLKENFSNVFWVGARRNSNVTSDISFEWSNGIKLSDEDWKEGQPKQPAAKFCIYLEFFSGYKAVNHYCGEKFPFICEYTEPMEE